MKSMALVPKTALRALVEREAKLRELVLGLRRERQQSHDMLVAALHELAAERGERDRQAYARNWIAAKRRAWASETSLPLGPPEHRGGDLGRNGSDNA